MDIIESLVDFEIRYTEDGHALCQAYTYVDTPRQSVCTRVADSVQFDISDKIFELTGYRFQIDCCMFCKKHTHSIISKIITVILFSIMMYGMRDPSITGVNRGDLNSIDFDKQEKVKDILRKDGISRKKRSRK